jgi:hypothetical protein
MNRTYFGRGCRGDLVTTMQRALSSKDYYTGKLDGQFGGGTETAVKGLQADRGLFASGEVDEMTWNVMNETPLPSLVERCLGVVAAFEGHGYSLVVGNFDGAWLTWGVIGFTLKHGEIERIVLEAWAEDPQIVSNAFGPETTGLIGRFQRNDRNELRQWADSISVGPSKVKVAEPWRTGFMQLGQSALVKQTQLRRAVIDYFAPAQRTAHSFGLSTELGIALAFDIHVQNGGIAAPTAQAIREAFAQVPTDDELGRRRIIANAVAEHALPKYVEDVRKRKLTIAEGNGFVHGESFTLARWGLGEYAS